MFIAAVLTTKMWKLLIDKNVACPYNEILLSLKKEGNSDICYNKDEPSGIMLHEINQTQTDKYCMIPRI
jgi:hypothetical protein